MKRYILMFFETQWHWINVDDPIEYYTAISLPAGLGDVLISFQTSDLIRELTKQNPGKSLPNIIDLECFDKQMSQEGKEFRDNSQWRIIHFLRYHKIIDSEYDFKLSTITNLLEKIAILFIQLLEKDELETTRFEKIETSINKIIYERQAKGLRINIDIAEVKCGEIEKEIYRIKNILQHDYNIYSPDSEKQQIEYLLSKSYSIIQSNLYSFKVRSNIDEVCLLFYELIRNEQDLDSFIYMLSHWGGSGKTYPTYLGFGTISSRITMRQPSVQNLRKSNRSVIIPDENKTFLYIDYSQFEAGILADLSADPELIDLYNSDIYTDLAEKVLGDKDKRSDAKIIFYRYMYGDKTLNDSAKAYFLQFKKLEEYRKSVAESIKKDKKIGTSTGNYRQCVSDDSPWSLSHVIQGTASLIYKNSLIRTKKEVRGTEFLVPMHDGTLYQIANQNYEAAKELIEDIYKSEFKKLCPSIEPKVTCSSTF